LPPASLPTEALEQLALPFSEFIAAFFGVLEATGVRCCVLRNYQEFPARNIGNDIDLLIAPTALPSAVHALRSIPGVRIVGYTQRPYVSNFFLEGISQNTDSCALEIDLDLRLIWKGLPYLSVEEVLEAAVAHPVGDATFYAPAPVHEAIISLFSSLLVGGWLKEKYFPQVRETFSECRTEVIAALLPRFGSEVATRLADAVISGDRSRILGMIGPLRRALLLCSLRRHPLRSIGAIFHHYTSELCFRHSPQSREAVSILALDARDRTPITQTLLPRLQSFATKIESEAAETTAQTGFGSAASLLRWMMRDWLSLLTERKSLTLTVREGCGPLFRDAAGQPDSPAWLARLAGRLTPAHDLCILLQEGAEENPAASSSRHEACRAFLQTRKRSVVLDTSQPVETVTEGAYAAIVDALVQRAEKRLKKRFP
jgi:hypothetical protein